MQTFHPVRFENVRYDIETRKSKSYRRGPDNARGIRVCHEPNVTPSTIRILNIRRELFRPKMPHTKLDNGYRICFIER